MGCGCGKPKPVNNKISSKRRGILMSKANSLSIDKQKSRNKEIKSRLIICKSCPYSVQNERDKKYNIRMCHKINRPISTTSSDLSFSCPIDKFKSKK